MNLRFIDSTHWSHQITWSDCLVCSGFGGKSPLQVDTWAECVKIKQFSWDKELRLIWKVCLIWKFSFLSVHLCGLEMLQQTHDINFGADIHGALWLFISCLHEVGIETLHSCPIRINSFNICWSINVSYRAHRQIKNLYLSRSNDISISYNKLFSNNNYDGWISHSYLILVCWQLCLAQRAGQSDLNPPCITDLLLQGPVRRGMQSRKSSLSNICECEDVSSAKSMHSTLW